MTQEGVEIVRASIEAWNRADFEAWIRAWDERTEGPTSGVELDVPLALLGVVRNGKLVYARCAAIGSG